MSVEFQALVALKTSAVWYNLIVIPYTLAISSPTSNITTSTQKPNSETRIENRITVAARDVAYYLRAYKFNEYDRRYVPDPDKGIREYYKKFPKPPLRSLHWEVAQHCEPSFHECIEYLWKKVKLTGSKRDDDTCVVIEENNWKTGNHSIQINTVEEECKKMRRIDDVVADPFEGPLERFQWRVTASYYMCMYTMLQTTELRRLYEPTCDNHANCLEGCDNKDSRANDTKPFACALYSFCPDPCCSNKVLNSPEECWNNPDNPCSRENEPGPHRKCSIVLDRNTDFNDIVLNRWNVSCRCPQSGMEWSSLYGICVDIDECAILGKHDCDRKVEACVNLPGTYRCVCKWGHIFNEQQKKCVPSAALEVVMLESQQKKIRKDEEVELWRRIARFIFRPPNSAVVLCPKRWLSIILFCAVRFSHSTY